MQWIKEFTMKEPALCDSLVKGFKKTRQLGFTHDGLSAKGVDKSWKDSEDASLNCFPIQIYAKTVRAYRQHVMSSVKAYMDCFPILENGAGKIGFLDPPQLQYYKPGGGFFGEHFESSGLGISHRVLAFQTFLNDIKDGGGTYFVYQDHTAAPKKGKTIIWPASFTHTHRGEIAEHEEKYVITGWLSYVSD